MGRPPPLHSGNARKKTFFFQLRPSLTIVLIMVTIVLVRRGRSVSGQTEQEEWRDGLMAKGADIALVTYTR